MVTPFAAPQPIPPLCPPPGLEAPRPATRSRGPSEATPRGVRSKGSHRVPALRAEEPSGLDGFHRRPDHAGPANCSRLSRSGHANSVGRQTGPFLPSPPGPPSLAARFVFRSRDLCLRPDTSARRFLSWRGHGSACPARVLFREFRRETRVPVPAHRESYFGKRRDLYGSHGPSFFYFIPSTPSTLCSTPGNLCSTPSTSPLGVQGLLAVIRGPRATRGLLVDTVNTRVAPGLSSTIGSGLVNCCV